jgi:membrane associated rhomboid family serine protease
MHATLTICATAIILSVAGWTRPGMDPFVLDARAFADEPWRILSAQFLHANLLHLWFNLSWIWYLGREVEQRLGERMLLGTTVFIALGTSAAVWAFDRSAIGLSGVVYGLWALCFVGQRRCPLLSGILTARTNQLMVVWFFFCIYVTWAGVLPISNWGHGAGAALGALVGLTLSEQGLPRPFAYPLGSALLALLGAGATVWWPKWNFGGAAVEFERRADAAQNRSDWSAVEHELTAQIGEDPKDRRAWWNLGVAQARQGRQDEATESFYRAFQCGSLDDEQKVALRASLLLQMNLKVLHGDARAALEFAKRAVEVAPLDHECWSEVASLAETLGDEKWSARAREELAKLGEKR